MNDAMLGVTSAGLSTYLARTWGNTYIHILEF